jgi:hypothetical protein
MAGGRYQFQLYPLKNSPTAGTNTTSKVSRRAFHSSIQLPFRIPKNGLDSSWPEGRCHHPIGLFALCGPF